MQPGVETGLEDICIFASADPVVLLTSACTEGYGHLWGTSKFEVNMFRYIRVLFTIKIKSKAKAWDQWANCSVISKDADIVPVLFW